MDTIVLTVRDLNDYEKSDFELQKPVLDKVEEGEVIHWNDFQSKDIKFLVLDKDTPKQKALIALVDGEVEGDLIIDGSNNKVRELLIHNCSVSGEIKVFNLRADKLEVTGSANNIILDNVVAKQTDFCVEVKESIIVKNIENSEGDMEINGFAKEVLAVNININLLNMKMIDCKRIKGKLVVADKIFVNYTKVDIEFDDLTADHFYFKDDSGRGLSHLVNSSLRL